MLGHGQDGAQGCALQGPQGSAGHAPARQQQGELVVEGRGAPVSAALDGLHLALRWRGGLRHAILQLALGGAGLYGLGGQAGVQVPHALVAPQAALEGTGRGGGGGGSAAAAAAVCLAQGLPCSSEHASASASAPIRHHLPLCAHNVWHWQQAEGGGCSGSSGLTQGHGLAERQVHARAVLVGVLSAVGQARASWDVPCAHAGSCAPGQPCALLCKEEALAGAVLAVQPGPAPAAVRKALRNGALQHPRGCCLAAIPALVPPRQHAAARQGHRH